MTRATVLLLPGQGAQRPRMAAELYGTQPHFTRAMDDFLTALGPWGTRLHDQWLRHAPNPALDDAAHAQPLLLALGHALGHMVTATTGRPDILLGHSIGELAAAALAGVLDPTDLPRLALARDQALGTDGHGRMAAVAATPADLAAHLHPDTAIAAVNGPRQTVLSGPAAAMDTTERRLRAAGITVLPLRSSHAFHSPLMAPAAQRFTDLWHSAGIRPRPPARTLVSTRTAAPLTAREATHPHFWTGQLTLPVRYWPALKTLLDTRGTTPGLTLLDAGPDHTLSAPARRHPAVRSGASRVVPLLAAHTAASRSRT
ncbi:acyltransferase domain-containing protein [Streptomyces xiamenensis]|uniref:acyltransferase domain-containing protein n=1 Tax=Streptomyces xiamenensis TaxID=408015 RepID=UPI0037D4CB8A